MWQEWITNSLSNTQILIIVIFECTSEQLPPSLPLPFPSLQDVRTACGVMYECVLGIPKSEGMQAPPKIPANPSFVELDEDENAVEKFKMAMGNIASILALDKLKQVRFGNIVVVYCLCWQKDNKNNS